ncbi:ArsR/SmtB family transcription factor [bacterium]
MSDSKVDKEFSRIFKALSNGNRLRVFRLIRAGHEDTETCINPNRPADIPGESVCVCEILEQMDITAPTLSHHLKELRNAGLVDVYNRGQWSYYTVRHDVLNTLEKFFNEESLCTSKH